MLDRAGPPICQVCGYPMHEPLFRCPFCETPHHDDCWTFNRGCSTFGCAGAPKRQLEARAPAVPQQDFETPLHENLTFLGFFASAVSSLMMAFAAFIGFPIGSTVGRVALTAAAALLVLSFVRLVPERWDLMEHPTKEPTTAYLVIDGFFLGVGFLITALLAVVGWSFFIDWCSGAPWGSLPVGLYLGFIHPLLTTYVRVSTTIGMPRLSGPPSK